MHSSLSQWYGLMLLCVLVHLCTLCAVFRPFTESSLNPQYRLMLLVQWGGAPEGGFPPKGVVAALPTTPPVGLDGDRGACPRSLLEQRWGRTAGVAMRTCIDQSVC